MPNDRRILNDIPYVAPLLGNIRQILTGLQGFDSMSRELIQNADDAGARTIRFNIENNSLRVWNDGIFQSCGLSEPKCPWELEARPSLGPRKACDFHAISSVGSGNKYRDPSLIGRFGIGFVSVYQITDAPIIRSLGVEIQLDPLRERNRVTAVDDVQGSEFELPWAFDGNSPIREALNASAITRGDIDSLQKDISAVADDCLLFLRNLSSIEITRDGKIVKRVARKSVDQNRIQLSFFPEDRKENWYVIRASAAKEAGPLRTKYPAIERLARQTDVQIAFNLGKPERNYGRLFAYLPTDQLSPVPCHINADFFPEQNRKGLVLSGEQHERYWNEMLLAVAAREISQHLLQLRDVLGPLGLWTLIEGAFDQRESTHFGAFWNAIVAASVNAPIVWSAGEKWINPEKCLIAPREMSADEERSLIHIGVSLAHNTLRPFQNALQVLGSRRLTLSAMVDALEVSNVLDDDAFKQKTVLSSFVRALWTAADALVQAALASIDGGREAMVRLKKIRFVMDAKGELASMNELYSLPSPVTNSQIKKHIGDLPIISEEFGAIGNLYKFVDVLTFERLLDEIADRITDQTAAKEFFGRDAKRIRMFYRFLSDYPGSNEKPDISAISNTPFLAGHNRFLSATEAVLPGGFRDPVGRFDTLDVSFFDDRSQEFLAEALNVQTLTFESYIKEHLGSILDDGISDGEYVALFDQLTAHADLLENTDIRAVLSSLPIVKTMDGAMRRPSECYFRSTELAELLGDEDALWVDTSVFVSFRSDVAKAFLTRLGMRSRPSLEHALDRIDAIVSKPPSVDRQIAIGAMLNFVFHVFEEDNVYEKQSSFTREIKRLRNTHWLPSSINGELQTGAWCAPHESYQPFRAAGFDSQVSVLAVRQNPRNPLTAKFLELIGMPPEPPTEVVVDHLIHCSERNIQPNEITYQILNERVRDEDDLLSIGRLKKTPCIYSSVLKQYLGIDRIFWSKPRIPRYCFQAPDWMHRYKDLFDFLGLKEEPDGTTYSGVLRDIAAKFGGQSASVPKDAQLIHEICLKALAIGLRESPNEARVLLEDLSNHPFLITLAGTLAFADEVALKDSCQTPSGTAPFAS